MPGLTAAPDAKAPTTGKTLVLCFDGTSEAFDDSLTNVMRLYGNLVKTDTSKQVCYYQPGIGTYSHPSIFTPISSAVANAADKAFAWYIGGHICDAYQFVLNHWQPGDQICLFGFSRGAYTARALVGMIDKIGVIQPDNLELIPIAYKLYKHWDPKDEKTVRDAARFKKHCSLEATVDFVGVWDTVGSIGYMGGRHLPFADSSIRVFRHAMALDEKRVEFPVNHYHYPTDSIAIARKDPERSSYPISNDKRDFSAEMEPVREVWFAGAHSDVGGGSVPNDVHPRLANLSLDWMLGQCVRAHEVFGINITFKASRKNGTVHRHGTDKDLSQPVRNELWNFHTLDVKKENTEEHEDTVGHKRAELTSSFSIRATLKTVFWCFLELLPLRQDYQNQETQVWRRTWLPHWWHPRVVYEDALVHVSVQQKMELADHAYTPKVKLPKVSFVEA